MDAHGSLATENEILQLKFSISNMGKIFKVAFFFLLLSLSHARSRFSVQGIFKFAYITPIILLVERADHLITLCHKQTWRRRLAGKENVRKI